jgi:hypothetical protein
VTKLRNAQRGIASSTPAILVDTNIVSGLVKGDLPHDQAQAVVTIVEMMQRSDVTLAGTTVMRDELNKFRRDTVVRTSRLPTRLGRSRLPLA